MLLFLFILISRGIKWVWWRNKYEIWFWRLSQAVKEDEIKNQRATSDLIPTVHNKQCTISYVAYFLCCLSTNDISSCSLKSLSLFQCWFPNDQYKLFQVLSSKIPLNPNCPQQAAPAAFIFYLAFRQVISAFPTPPIFYSGLLEYLNPAESSFDFWFYQRPVSTPLPSGRGFLGL